MTAEYFARNQYRDYVIYKALAETEKNPDFKIILENLTAQEREDYQFWEKVSSIKEFSVSGLEVAAWRLMRRILGLTFMAKFMEGREKEMIEKYRVYLAGVKDIHHRKGVETIIEHEIYHERSFLSQIKEEKVEFIANIILGINDGLIELTGALTGFAFAFDNKPLVAVTGLITGMAASLSMASSAYMQARHQEGKDARRAGIYTGISYLTVVAILVGPYFIFTDIVVALLAMYALVLCIIAGASFYTGILFERHFWSQFREMATFSLGVVIITFLFGRLVRSVAGIDLGT